MIQRREEEKKICEIPVNNRKTGMEKKLKPFKSVNVKARSNTYFSRFLYVHHLKKEESFFCKKRQSCLFQRQSTVSNVIISYY